MQQKELLNIKNPIWQNYLPIIDEVKLDNIPISIWDIPFTIHQLSYLTHSHFRYYGKFPSVLAGQIIDSYYTKGSKRPIFDNFCGSGTTLVESSLRGIPSYGIDVSWLSVMVSNVKTNHIDIKKTLNILDKICSNYFPILNSILSKKEEKWFEVSTVMGLKSIQNQLLNFSTSLEVKFLICAFLTIIRRTSRAFDGEVRPHINKGKKFRDPLDAFSKKVRKMLRDQLEYQSFTSPSLQHKCFLGSAENASKVYNNEPPVLIISHPPYLNVFNYAPVFSLEYLWGKLFEKKFVDKTNFYKEEIIAYPANKKNVDRYFNLLRLAYKESYKMQLKGDILTIVIGDCTRNKKLIPVIDTLKNIVSEIGYTPIGINYRTTHYGTGKYAYNNRSDYHNNINSKKDGVLVFRK
mgnify:CR=1 FL=1